MDEEENQALYDALEADLLRQVHALEQELLGMQQGQAIVEGALRKKKAKAEQEVEVGSWLATKGATHGNLEAAASDSATLLAC